MLKPGLLLLANDVKSKAVVLEPEPNTRPVVESAWPSAALPKRPLLVVCVLTPPNTEEKLEEALKTFDPDAGLGDSEDLPFIAGDSDDFPKRFVEGEFDGLLKTGVLMDVDFLTRPGAPFY